MVKINKRISAIAPMVLDMLAPVVSFYLLHYGFGVSPVIALTIGAAAAGLRGLYRLLTERRINAFPLMIMVLLVVSIALVFLTGDARLVLAKSAVTPIVGGIYGLVTNFFGRTVVYDVLTPFTTKGDPRLLAAWRDAWKSDPAFVRRMKLLNVLWGIGFIIGGTVRIVVVYSVPLDVGVLLGQVPTIVMLLSLGLLTWALWAPLGKVLRGAESTPAATFDPATA